MKINLAFRNGEKNFEIKGISSVNVSDKSLFCSAPESMTKTIVNEFVAAGVADWCNVKNGEIAFRLSGCSIVTLNVIEL